MTILHARLFNPTHCRLSLKSAALAVSAAAFWLHRRSNGMAVTLATWGRVSVASQQHLKETRAFLF